MPLEEVDPLEFFDIQMVKKDDAPPSQSEFSVRLTAWTEDGLGLNLQFDTPLEISTGANTDKMKFRVKSPEYFVSAESGEMLTDGGLDADDAIMVSIPSQLPEGVKLETVQS